MTTETLSNIPRLSTLHALAFGIGIVGTLIGIFAGNAHWFLLAGPNLVLSGVLLWVGSRITFTGPAGDVLRAVLGPARVRGINLRAIVWMLAGLLVCLWGLQSLRDTPRDEGPLQEPLVRDNA